MTCDQKEFSQADYQQLCEQVWQHNQRYYAEHQPIITDVEYDQLYRDIQTMERAHPEWICANSPTQRVAEGLTTGFASVRHKTPMLSLENCYSKKELEAFLNRMQKLTESSALEFSCELKMDGIAISACYEHGKLIRGATRGNGREGDDITANIRTIAMLPLDLAEAPPLLEIRGEVYIAKAMFVKLNEERLKNHEELWANPRNAAAGTLKLLNPAEVARRRLSIAFYGIAEESRVDISLQSSGFEYLRSLGLPTLQHTAICSNSAEIWEFIEKIRELRSSLPFHIDGVVVKLNSRLLQKMIGTTAKHPRWAIAYKFAAEQAITKVREITLQIGRSGVLTPVAELEPVLLAGSTISRATLHNAEEVERKDIRIGDAVYIEKGGDVIPKVVKVILEYRPAETSPWLMPDHCPVCGSHVVRVAGEVAVRCPNRTGCLQQSLRRISHFAGKGAMEIDGLGKSIIAQLVEKSFVNSPSDIYKLTADELAQLEGFRDKAIHNLLSSIEKSKEVPLERLIMALGIPHIGQGAAEEIARKVKSIDRLAILTTEELLEIGGIGEKSAQALASYFADSANQHEIQQLLQLGVKPIYKQPAEHENHFFTGKSFVLTGALNRLTRNEAAILIKERGGSVSESVSKKTDFLVAGEAAGSKLEKAKKLNVIILNEEEFEKML